ncbi:histone-like nucleoid-structuring protein Lsr2 [Streptomyces sp. NPDC094038]|uniref:Lsr2 dimerization domain-containing protein n=1 Tax=Streptomyces sp. NPDC094038 TaxID=3366055 RepID=UPI00382F1A3B
MEHSANLSNHSEPLIDYDYPLRSEIEFGLDGQNYSIELTEGGADELRAQLAPFIEAGRLVRSECDDSDGFHPRLAPFIEIARLARLERARAQALPAEEPSERSLDQ